MEVNAAALSSIRQLNGKSQYQLSKDSGVSQGFISELESGTKTKVRATTIKKLADALNVPVAALATVTVNPKLAERNEQVPA